MQMNALEAPGFVQSSNPSEFGKEVYHNLPLENTSKDSCRSFQGSIAFIQIFSGTKTKFNSNIIQLPVVGLGEKRKILFSNRLSKISCRIPKRIWEVALGLIHKVLTLKGQEVRIDKENFIYLRVFSPDLIFFQFNTQTRVLKELSLLLLKISFDSSLSKPCGITVLFEPHLPSSMLCLNVSDPIML